MSRSMPAFSIMHQSRPKRKPVPAVGDLTPVRPGGLGHHIMRCSKGHEEPYLATGLRRKAEDGGTVRCRTCVAIEKLAVVFRAKSAQWFATGERR